MKRLMKRLLYWSPRVLGILYAAYLSMFALDAFGEGYGFWGTILVLGMHLIPAGFVVIVLAISWRWEWVGALLFVGASLYYTLTTLRHPDWVLAIVGPAFLIGVLFLLNWHFRKQLRGGS